jgi:ABC-type antimicrobial peptide transport system permease subunit
MNHLVGESLSIRRFCTAIITITSCLAVLIAMIGLYAVTAFSIAERRNEVGIRLALGATPKNILLLVSKRALLLTGIGLGSGLILSIILCRLFNSLLYDVSATDPLTLILTAILLFAVSLLACWIPTKKATRLHPMEVLRYE